MANGKVRPEQMDPEPAAAVHGSSHSLGGSDEVEVDDLAATGIAAGRVLTANGADGAAWSVPAAPAAHAASHQNGGADEINVTALSGVLGDPQNPVVHAADHEEGGADEIDLMDMGTAAVIGTVPVSDGAGGVDPVFLLERTAVALGAPVAFPVGFAAIGGGFALSLTDGVWEIDYSLLIVGTFNWTGTNTQSQLYDTTGAAVIANTTDARNIAAAALPVAVVSSYSLHGKTIFTVAGGPKTIDVRVSGVAADAAAGATIVSGQIYAKRLAA